MGGTPIGGPVVGWGGQAFGPRGTLIGGGALTIAGVLFAVLFIGQREDQKFLTRWLTCQFCNVIHTGHFLPF